MQYLKKYFTEGLIQMAILLSLCGMRVDVGLEPHLPPTWHDMLLGPTSALTQTELYNLRNHQENGHSLHPKNVDLDGFFTARRLLGWVHSLDRLQVGKSIIYLQILVHSLSYRQQVTQHSFNPFHVGPLHSAGDVACSPGARLSSRGSS